jgi:hypothetical protein
MEDEELLSVFEEMGNLQTLVEKIVFAKLKLLPLQKL